MDPALTGVGTMTNPPDRLLATTPFDDENTDGATRFEQATRAARDLAGLSTDQTERTRATDGASATPSGTTATPLQPFRVVFLIGAMVAFWFGFMLWDTWGG